MKHPALLLLPALTLSACSQPELPLTYQPLPDAAQRSAVPKDGGVVQEVTRSEDHWADGSSTPEETIRIRREDGSTFELRHQNWRELGKLSAGEQVRFILKEGAKPPYTREDIQVVMQTGHAHPQPASSHPGISRQATLGGLFILSAPSTPGKPEPKDWELFGMEEEAYDALTDALDEDKLAEVQRLLAAAGKKPDHDFLELCLQHRAGYCLEWALAMGVTPRTSDEYWPTLLTDWSCDVDEQEADKVGKVLTPLLRANPELKTNKKLITPVIIYLAEFGCRDTMRRVLELGAPAEVENEKGHTALDYALFYGYEDIAAMLRAHGATRFTPRPTAQQVWEKEVQEAERRRQKVEAEHQARLKALKPGEPAPIKPIVIEPMHRPTLD